MTNPERVDNVLVDSDDPAICVAVLDWDMCTRGDPLMDLGNAIDASQGAELAGTLALDVVRSGEKMEIEIELPAELGY